MKSTSVKKTQYGLAYFVSIVCLLIAVLIIFFNTNSAKNRLERDSQIESEAVEVDPFTIDPVNEGKYVIIKGSLQTDQVFHDQLFDIKFPGIAYNRMAEQAQLELVEDSDGNTYEENRWVFSAETYNDINQIESHSKSKGILEYVASEPIKIQNTTITSEIFHFDREIWNPIFLENYFDFQKNPEYYLVDNHQMTNADDPEYPHVGAGRYSFYGIPNGANVTLLGIQQDSTIGTSGYSKVISGIKNRSEIFRSMKTDAIEVESGFNYFGLFFLIICSLPMSYLIKEGKVFEPMHSGVFNLKLGRLIYIILLTIFLFQGLVGFAKLLFSGDPLSAINHLGYVVLIVLATKLLFGREILPKFLFKDKE